MKRITACAALWTVILSAWMFSSAEAQTKSKTRYRAKPVTNQRTARLSRSISNRIQTLSRLVPGRLPASPGARPVGYVYGGQQRRNPHAAGAGGSAYPYLNAPMYPTPRPDIPYRIGGTLITNQAFAPHEMLYPHTYRAMYPPFYYKVSGGWVVTPWGVWSRDKWELRGTEVEVKYHSRISILSGFIPPSVR